VLTINEDGNFDVVDTKLEEMHEKIDAINKTHIKVDTDGNVSTDEETK